MRIGHISVKGLLVVTHGGWADSAILEAGGVDELLDSFDSLLASMMR